MIWRYLLAYFSIEEILKLRDEVKELKEEAAAFESDLVPWTDEELESFVPGKFWGFVLTLFFLDFAKKLTSDEAMNQREKFMKLVDDAAS